jgi:putative flavoprotein involved in K+ transport
MERISTIVIGGGQAGLSVGYHLSRLGVPFLILEANERIGDNWRCAGTRCACSRRRV